MNLGYRNPRTLTYVLAGLLAGSVALNCAQIIKLNRMQSRVAARPSIKPGTLIPPIAVVDAAGKTSELRYDGNPRPTVVYVTRAGCSWCERNRSNIDFLSTRFESKYRFVELSLLADKNKKLEAEKEGSRPARSFYGVTADKMFELYHINATPQTLVVASNGQVLKNWSGAYNGRIREEVDAFFGTQVPGLTPASQVSH